VSARVRRQEILEDRTKNFHFVMTETVLRNRVCPPAEMMAQIARLRAFAGSPNVSVGFIPADAEFVIPPQHGFTMLDDRMVIMDLYNTGLTSPGRMDSRRYRQVFDLFEGLAVADNGPMLDRYEQLYLDLLRRPAAPGQAG
jgi:hypothetical protein